MFNIIHKSKLLEEKPTVWEIPMEGTPKRAWSHFSVGTVGVEGKRKILGR